MDTRLKGLFLFMMVSALGFGFMHHLIPKETLNFERLHIFLFNLCSGGTLLVYYTEGRKKISASTVLFLSLSIFFAFTAFFEWYLAAFIIPILLFLLMEKIRIRHFGAFFPLAIFSGKEPVSRKFHQASLLCLSIGLLLSSFAIFNSEYGKWFFNEKFKLDTFFLGFSFPVSLISFSLIFTLMKGESMAPSRFLRETSFWVINLGVIIFFLFILAGMFKSQLFAATLLFLAVSLILFLYNHEGLRMQEKAFLTSGIFFLLVTSLTGIAYILLAASPWYLPEYSEPLLRLHAFTALYGWNLSGLVIIIRDGDFPLQLHSKKVIFFHWLTVFILCPVGYFSPWAAFFAVFFYALLLMILFFAEERRKK
ncbi:hypothetical protein LJC24_03330 [Desulfococcaceae bacterium OttesenSCG-928-F15]|nr:hypothetical protein [Desulfococcaceae bacterium OttesenSCG-928-F15]